MSEWIHKLAIHGPEIERAGFKIKPGKTIIGREPGVNLQLPDKQVSRHHAQIDLKGEDCHITDLESSNGTKLNGKSLQPHAPELLQTGAVIEIGPYRLIYERTAVEPRAVAGKSSSLEALLERQPRQKRNDPGEDSQPDGRAERASPEKPLGTKPGVRDGADGGGTDGSEDEARRAQLEGLAGPGGRRNPKGTPGSAGPALLDDGELASLGLSLESRSLVNFLPGIYQGDFMKRFLGIFEVILTPIEWNIDNFDLFLHPETAPSGFLPWLANWFLLVFDSTWNEAQRRKLLVESHQLYARRGTAWALARALEIYTGQVPEIDDLAEDLEAHTFRVRLPMEREQVKVELIEALINANKPAHTNYILYFKED